MCGRYELDNIEGIAERYDVDTDDIELQPNHNVRPTQIMPVVVFDDQAKRNKLKLMRWGIRPHWAKKDLINAQSEKISTSSVWKKMHHGIVVAKRFYEWDQ